MTHNTAVQSFDLKCYLSWLWIIYRNYLQKYCFHDFSFEFASGCVRGRCVLYTMFVVFVHMSTNHYFLSDTINNFWLFSVKLPSPVIISYDHRFSNLLLRKGRFFSKCFVLNLLFWQKMHFYNTCLTRKKKHKTYQLLFPQLLSASLVQQNLLPEIAPWPLETPFVFRMEVMVNVQAHFVHFGFKAS